jgi:large subunit ribosomal protein L17
MRKNVFGRQFKRDSNERKALFKNLLTSLVMEEHIKTTPAKAKAIRGAADKLVTKAKKGGDSAFRNLAPDVNHNAVVKLVSDLALRFANRQGGYTRIIKLGKNRVADNAPQVLMEWVERASANVELKAENKKQVADANKKQKTKNKELKKAAASNAVKAEKTKKSASNADKKNTKEVKKAK